jgi:hypothetical protein
VFYFVGCMIVGGVAGGIAGSQHQDFASGQRAGAEAGAKAVQENQVYIFAGGAILAVLAVNVGAFGRRKHSDQLEL